MAGKFTFCNFLRKLFEEKEIFPLENENPTFTYGNNYFSTENTIGAFANEFRKQKDVTLNESDNHIHLQDFPFCECWVLIDS
jgi:hypothetical protein